MSHFPWISSLNFSFLSCHHGLRGVRLTVTGPSSPRTLRVGASWATRRQVPARPRRRRCSYRGPEENPSPAPGAGGAVTAGHWWRRRHGGGGVHDVAGDVAAVTGVQGGGIQVGNRGVRCLMDAEAGTSLIEAVNEGGEAWRRSMAAAGFQEAAFGDKVVESVSDLEQSRPDTDMGAAKL
jgi:hypothetical protein